MLNQNSKKIKKSLFYKEKIKILKIDYSLLNLYNISGIANTKNHNEGGKL
jgi:hypothetical protein